MKRYLIIAGAVVCLIFIGWRLLSFYQHKQPQANPNRLDKIDPTALPQGDKVIVPGKLGDVETNNFLRGAQEITAQRIGLIVNSSVGAAYSPSDSTFYITISAENLAEFERLRAETENALLTKLGVPQQQLCQLKVVIRTMPSPDPAVDSKTFPLSFCSN